MGGRGSGGGRNSGGNGGSLSKFTNKSIDLINPNSKDFNQSWQNEYSKMSDSDLNRAYKNSKQNLNKEYKNLEREQSKLKSILDNFKITKETDFDYKAKSDAINKQMSNVDRALNRVKVRETVHYLAVNERYNVRGKNK